MKKLLDMQRQSTQYELAKSFTNSGIETYISDKKTAQMLLAIFGTDGEKILRERWGNKYDIKMLQYQLACVRLMKLEGYLNDIETNTIKKEDITNPKWRAFQKRLGKFSLVETTIPEVLWALIENADIRNLPIGQRIIWNVMPKDKKNEDIKMSGKKPREYLGGSDTQQQQPEETP